MREREALSCLASIGIPAENVHFFRIENQMGLRNPVVLADLHRRLAALIREVEPYAVVTSAFEGGHGDHDLTNYALAKAVVSTSFPPWRVFEAPEYNSLFLRHAFFRRVNPYLLIPFIICPLFPPCCVRGKTLEMNNDELAAKKRMFEHFQSQTPFQLIHRFGFPDQFRQLPSRDYVAEFWAWEHTWSFRLKVLLFGVGRFPTYRLSARQFEILIKMVENSAEETP